MLSINRSRGAYFAFNVSTNFQPDVNYLIGLAIFTRDENTGVITPQTGYAFTFAGDQVALINTNSEFLSNFSAFVSGDQFSMIFDGRILRFYINGNIVKDTFNQPILINLPPSLIYGFGGVFPGSPPINPPILINSINLYPTPVGIEGATSFTLTDVSTNGSVVLNSNTSVTLYSDANGGGTVRTTESIDTSANGLIFQFNAPPTGAYTVIYAGFVSSVFNTFIVFANMSFIVYDTFSNTLYAGDSYEEGEIFRFQSDGTNVYVSQSGITRATDSLSSYTDPVVFGAIAYVSQDAAPVTVDGIRFYSTGNGGRPFIAFTPPETTAELVPTILEGEDLVPDPILQGGSVTVFDRLVNDLRPGVYSVSIDLYFNIIYDANAPNGNISLYLTYNEDEAGSVYNTINTAYTNINCGFVYIPLRAVIPMPNPSDSGNLNIILTNTTGDSIISLNATIQNVSIVLVTTQFSLP